MKILILNDCQTQILEWITRPKFNLFSTYPVTSAVLRKGFHYGSE